MTFRKSEYKDLCSICLLISNKSAHSVKICLTVNTVLHARQTAVISTGQNARSRHHCQWEVRLFSWHDQVPRPHHFTGGHQSGSGQGWSHHQPPKTDQYSGVATTLRNGEPYWEVHTKSGLHHQASLSSLCTGFYVKPVPVIISRQFH